MSERRFRDCMRCVCATEEDRASRGGRWVLPDAEGEPLSPALKPGGHGAIWKLMHDQGVFTWLAAKGRKGGVVRQITNPMAGTDTTLLALSGGGSSTLTPH